VTTASGIAAPEPSLTTPWRELVWAAKGSIPARKTNRLRVNKLILHYGVGDAP
jgi:hypothetical protein